MLVDDTEILDLISPIGELNALRKIYIQVIDETTLKIEGILIFKAKNLIVNIFTKEGDLFYKTVLNPCKNNFIKIVKMPKPIEKPFLIYVLSNNLITKRIVR